jgi:hypothetical protein
MRFSWNGGTPIEIDDSRILSVIAAYAASAGSYKCGGGGCGRRRKPPQNAWPLLRFPSCSFQEARRRSARSPESGMGIETALSLFGKLIGLFRESVRYDRFSAECRSHARFL